MTTNNALPRSSTRSSSNSAGLCISLMGPFTMWFGEREIPATVFPRRKALHLLKLIALQPRQQLHREQVIELLWSHLAPRSATAQLYKAVHHVRQALATVDPPCPVDALFESNNEILRLTAPGGVHTDVTTFEQLAKEAIRVRETSLLQRAVAGYRGDLLPDELYEEWTIAPRDALRERLLDLLVILGKAYRDGGYLAEAVDVLRQALERDPIREDVHVALMRVYALQGSRARAIRQYQKCTETLAQELGVAPASETTALHEKIVQGRVQPLRARYALQTTEPPLLPPLVGRKFELEVIDELMKGLKQGTGRVLALEGVAGIGKTRLAREIMQMGVQELQVLSGSAHEQEGQIPYMPFIEALRKAVLTNPEDAHLIPAELAIAIPELPSTVTSVAIADRLAAQSALFAGVQRFVAARAQRAPLILILDDLHAADPGSLKLFHYLARQTANNPLLLVGIWRTGAPDASPNLQGIVSSLERQGLLQRLALAPLSKNEHRDLLELTLEDNNVDSVLVDEIYHLSAGNPLFAKEIVRQLTVERKIMVVDNNWRLTTETQEAGTGPIPPLSPSGQTLVSSRLTFLSPEALRLLQFAAVVGQDVPLILLEEWSDSGKQDAADPSLWDMLEGTIGAGLLKEKGFSYRFSHPLFRQIIYHQMSHGRRRALHGEVGVVLEQLFESGGAEMSVEGVAFHYLQAGDAERAVRYLVESGRRAEALYDHDSAMNRYEEALSLLEEQPLARTAALRAEIHERIGDVQRAIGNVARSLEAYLQVLGQSEAPSGREVQLALHRKVTLAAILTPDIPTAADHLNKAWSLLEEDALEQARMLITQALFDWHANQLEAAVEHASQALEIAEEAGGEVEASQACEMLAMAHFPLGNWEEGFQYELRRQTADWSPEIVVAVDAHLCLYQFRLQGVEPYRQVKQFIEMVAEQASTLGNLRCLAVCHYVLGSLALLQGRPELAGEQLTKALELHQRIGSPAAAAYTLARQIQLLTVAGAAGAGWNLVPEALEMADQAAIRDHCMMLVHTAGIQNRLSVSDLAAAGDLVQAAEEHDAAVAPCSICSVDRYVAIASFYLAVRDFAKASKYTERALQFAQHAENRLGQARALRVQAQIAAEQGRIPQAELDIAEATAIFRGLNSQFDLASTLHIWANLPTDDNQALEDTRQARQEEAEQVRKQFRRGMGAGQGN